MDIISELSKLVEAKDEAAELHWRAKPRSWFTQKEEHDYVDDFIHAFEGVMEKMQAHNQIVTRGRYTSKVLR